MSDLLRSFSIVIPTKQVIPLAIDLFDRYSLSHWDSMLVAACIDAGVHTLYSEDLSHNATYDSLRVVNPFAPAMPEG
jgi:predicted nucleic acid-binding protein